jgi:hypothetical protein
MRNIAIISIAVAVLALSPHVLSQTSTFADFDPVAAEKNIREGSRRFSKSLHEFERYPDGARGFGAPNTEALRVARPSPPPPPFATALEWNTYYDYCASDAIVLAVNLDSTPILTHDKSIIYTMSHFSVVDVIRSDDAMRPGQRLVAYRLGGTLEDAGEKLRIDTPDMAAFEPQKEYILGLKRDRLASVAQYSLPEALTIAVTKNNVYPIPGKNAWFTGSEAFPSGTPYSEIKDNFARVAKRKACQ